MVLFYNVHKFPNEIPISDHCVYNLIQFRLLIYLFSDSTMMRFVIFSCLVAQALSACFTPENFNCRDFTGTFPDPRDCGQSFVQVIASNVFSYLISISMQNFMFIILFRGSNNQFKKYLTNQIFLYFYKTKRFQ